MPHAAWPTCTRTHSPCAYVLPACAFLRASFHPPSTRRLDGLHLPHFLLPRAPSTTSPSWCGFWSIIRCRRRSCMSCRPTTWSSRPHTPLWIAAGRCAGEGEWVGGQFVATNDMGSGDGEKGMVHLKPAGKALSFVVSSILYLPYVDLYHPGGGPSPLPPPPNLPLPRSSPILTRSLPPEFFAPTHLPLHFPLWPLTPCPLRCELFAGPPLPPLRCARPC